MLIHSEEKPFSCSQCGNTFTRKESLKDHMLIHAGIKPFTCSQCGKSFTQKRQLKDHLHIHSSEKPFSCSQCGNTFICNRSLKDHMLIHAGIKPLPALSVERVLYRKGNLRIICIFTLQKSLSAAFSAETLSRVTEALRGTC